MDPLSKAREVLARRITDPKAKMFGLSEDLRVILDAFAELERRCGVLASIALHRHYWPGEPMHPASWQALSEMSDRARALYRIGEHGAQCECQQCCLYRLTKG